MAAHALPSACSKTHAARLRWAWLVVAGRDLARDALAWIAVGRLCDRRAGTRTSVAQGKPCAQGRLLRGTFTALILAAGGGSMAAAGPACPGPALRFEALAPGLWRVPGFIGEADAANRGQVSNLTLASEAAPAGSAGAGQLWALGSGPSPAFGQTLACQARQQLGMAIVAVISPWARPELVLGAGGVVQAGAAQGLAVTHWALDGVADAMAEQCPHCVDRLRQRLQAAADDLGDNPISAPDRRLVGDHGVLGPWLWWRLPRADGRWVTVWRSQTQPLWLAPGLLDSPGPADGRDADLALLWRSTQRLAKLAEADGDAARFVGEQGAVMDSGAPARHAAYWAALLDTVAAAIGRGDDEAAPAPALPGVPVAWTRHPWHSFNWQRAWRQVEAQSLALPATPVDSPVLPDQRATFQRSLR